MSTKAQLADPASPQVREGQLAGPDRGEPALSVDDAIRRTHRMLRQIQAPSGWWWGELESNPTMEAEYVFLRHILGVPDTQRNKQIARHIQRRQLPAGGWSMYSGGAGDLSTSVECYTALKIAGNDPDLPHMQQAKAFIHSKGGVEKCRIFTKIWLAMMGQWEWHGTPYLPPEIIFLPGWAPFNIYSFGSWTRATVVPMTVILSENPTYPLPRHLAIDELYPSGRENADYSIPPPSGINTERFVYVADRLLHTAEKLPLKPLRGLARRRIKQWVIDHQEADGSWGGIQPPWVYSLIALKQLGVGVDEPIIQKGLEGFDKFAIDDGDGQWRVQACVSPVWDTCLTVNSLLESGMLEDDRTIVTAADWLVSKQIDASGDWQEKVRGVQPGGWAFEFDNQTYPDTDDAAEVLLAIGRAATSDPFRKNEAVRRGMEWLLSMQSRNGGWGSFDKDNTSKITTSLPFFDFGEVIDPPSVDVTAHILEAIGTLGWPTDNHRVQKALDYIWREQEPDGPWFGRWGVNYIYGTGAVLPGLEAVGVEMSDPRVQLAADWVESRQNSDGGWGETCASYADPGLRGRGESTASQTAWAMLALIAAGRVDRDAVRLGADFLVRTQRGDGAWDEPQYTATGFPGYGIGDRRFKGPEAEADKLLPTELPSGFMIKYHMYRIYWPLLALGRYRERRAADRRSQVSAG